MSRVEIAVLIVCAALAAGVVRVTAVCLIRRVRRRRAEQVERSLLDVIGRR
jgi:hypothetical protein